MKMLWKVGRNLLPAVFCIVLCTSAVRQLKNPAGGETVLPTPTPRVYAAAAGTADPGDGNGYPAAAGTAETAPGGTAVSEKITESEENRTGTEEETDTEENIPETATGEAGGTAAPQTEGKASGVSTEENTASGNETFLSEEIGASGNEENHTVGVSGQSGNPGKTGNGSTGKESSGTSAPTPEAASGLAITPASGNERSEPAATPASESRKAATPTVTESGKKTETAKAATNTPTPVPAASAANTPTATPTPAPTATPAVVPTGLKDGSYSAVATVDLFGYDVTVSVKISGGKVTKVTISDSSTDENNYEFMDLAIAGLTSQIKKMTSSADRLDAVSGATYSGDAIIRAAREALEKAE